MAGQIKVRFLVTNPGQQPFDFRLFRGSDRQQRRAGTASVVAVEVAGVLDARNAQLANDALAHGRDALLFLFGKLKVVVLQAK